MTAIAQATKIRDYFQYSGATIPTTWRDPSLKNRRYYQQEVWNLYDWSPEVDPLALPGYSVFIDELKDQFNYMIGAGVLIEFCDDDPTPINPVTGNISAKLCREEYLNTGILRIYRSDGSHPVLDRYGIPHNGRWESMNSIFRAVHDFLGHFATGADFGWSGETTAYYSHASTFSISARRALFCETVAQQCGYYVTGNYVPQKAVFYDEHLYPHCY